MEVMENIDVCDQLCSNAVFSDTFTRKTVGFVFEKGNDPIYVTLTDGKIVLDRATYVKIGEFVQKNIAQCSLAVLGKVVKTAEGLAFAQGDKEKPVFLYHYKLKIRTTMSGLPRSTSPRMTSSRTWSPRRA